MAGELGATLPVAALTLLAALLLPVLLPPWRANRLPAAHALARGIAGGLPAVLGAGFANLAILAPPVLAGTLVPLFAPMTFLLMRGGGLIVLFWLVFALLERPPRRIVAADNDNLAADGFLPTVGACFSAALADRRRALLSAALLPQAFDADPEGLAAALPLLALTALAAFAVPALYACFSRPLTPLIHRPLARGRDGRTGSGRRRKAGSVTIGYGRHAA